MKHHSKTSRLTTSLILTASVSSLYGQEAADTDQNLDETVIVAQDENDKANPDFLKSLRFTDDLKNTPITTQVIPDFVINDLQPRRFEEILEFAAGVAPANGFGNTNDAFRIRGFDANIAEDGIVTGGAGIFGDGFRKRNAATIESVEVLRGPQGALFGGGGLGGTINIVTKSPEAGQFLRTRSTASSEGLLRQEVDYNFSFGDLDQYRLRVIASAEDDDRDFIHADGRCKL